MLHCDETHRPHSVISIGDRGSCQRRSSGCEFRAPIPLGFFFVSPEWRKTWRNRVWQVQNDPAAATWITRAIVNVDRGVAVGRAGFHGLPSATGLVEVGYAVDPAFRRQGYARAALVALLKWAREDATIHKVRASIRPDNLLSLALVRQYAFVKVGEQWDEEDGLEDIFGVDAGLA